MQAFECFRMPFLSPAPDCYLNALSGKFAFNIFFLNVVLESHTVSSQPSLDTTRMLLISFLF